MIKNRRIINNRLPVEELTTAVIPFRTKKFCCFLLLVFFYFTVVFAALRFIPIPSPTNVSYHVTPAHIIEEYVEKPFITKVFSKDAAKPVSHVNLLNNESDTLSVADAIGTFGKMDDLLSEANTHCETIDIPLLHDQTVFAFIAPDGSTCLRIIDNADLCFRNVLILYENNKIKVKVDDTPVYAGETVYGSPTPEENTLFSEYGLTKVYGETGLYQNSVSRLYYLYGSYNNEHRGFYICDTSGHVLTGRYPVNLGGI